MRSKIILVSIVILATLLRLLHLGINPPSLYWDEASLGYNGWSISQNLKDEHGDFLPFTNFKAFGDYKPPVYIYLAAASVKVFGLNEFSVRFPSALFGVITVICTYFIVKYLIKLFPVGVYHGKPLLGLLSSFFLAISPWSINLSRVAFEANVASGLFLIGLTFFLYFFCSDRSRPVTTIFLTILTPLFFVLPLYTFNSSRIFIPLFTLVLLVLFYKTITINIKTFLFSLLTFLLLLAPLVPHLMSKEGRLRFNEVNIFTNPIPVEISNSRIQRDNGALWSKIINNRRVYFFKDYLKHFSDNFKGDFLFLTGDVNATFSTRRNGELYIFDLILIITGLYFLWFRARKLCLFLLFWLLAGIAPSGVARETPHALRTMNLLPAYQIFSAFGLLFLVKVFKNYSKDYLSFRRPPASLFEELRAGKPESIKIIFGTVIIILFSSYLLIYYKIYPKEQSKYFEYGYKELVSYINANKNKYDKIYLSSVRGRPYIYFLFYGKIPENVYPSESDVSEDSFGFYNVSRLQNIYFVNGAIMGQPNSLTVAAPEEFGKQTNLNIIKKIKFLDGSDNFWIVRN